MDLGAFLSLAMGASFCVGGAVLCIGRWSRVRHLQDTPTSRIRSAAQGYTELVGVLGAASESPLFAPLTGEPCLWWRYCIEEYRASGKRSSWAVIERGESEGWLRLTDATGECLIDPRGAEVLPAWRRRWTGDRRHPRGGARGGLLQLLGMGSRYRYTEERLHAGEPLYAWMPCARRSFGNGRVILPACSRVSTAMPTANWTSRNGVGYGWRQAWRRRIASGRRVRSRCCIAWANRAMACRSCFPVMARM